MRRIALVALMAAGPAGADGLTGSEIATALTGRTLVYDGGATQDFRSSGRTLYVSGRPSWGYWEVRGDAYCSLWPPSDQWDCYGVELTAGGVTFVGQAGDRTTGHYAEDN